MTGSGSGGSSDRPDRYGDDDGRAEPGNARSRDDDASLDSGRSTGQQDPDSRSTDAGPRGTATSGAGGRSETGNPSGGRGRRSVTIEDDGVVRWFLKSDAESVAVVRDVLTSVAIVAVIALILFGASGIWPPLVAVESGSMEPNMYKGDLVFVVDEQRYVGDDPIDGTGVVPYLDGQESGHTTFGEAGDVIIFQPDGDEYRTPVIHRAHFWVEAEENWVETQADPALLNGYTCDDLRTCPANHDGFVTMGDANPGYDQAGTGAPTDVVRPEWIEGKAMFRVPYLGHVRLTFDRLLFGGVTPGLGPMAAPVLVGAVTVGGAVAGLGSRRR